MINLTSAEWLEATIESAPVDIFVTFQRHGLHKYPGAPDEVSYLAAPHRHLFKFRVEVAVTHDNREIEFHMFQNWLMGQYEQGVLELDYKSCEMIAREMVRTIIGAWGDRKITIEVAEDGECGAVLRYIPKEK